MWTLSNSPKGQMLYHAEYCGVFDQSCHEGYTHLIRIISETWVGGDEVKFLSSGAPSPLHVI